MVMLLAIAATLASCRPSVVAPELNPTIGAPVVRAGEPVQVVVDGAKPPYHFLIVSGLGEIDPDSGLFLPADEGGEVVIRTVDGDGRSKDIVIQTIGKLILLPQTAIMRSGGTYTLGAKGGVPPYQFEVLSGPASVDRVTGRFSVSGAGSVNVGIRDSDGKSASAVFQVSEVLSLSLDSPVQASFIHSASNSLAYSVSGTCNFAGLPVELEVDGFPSGAGTVCDGATWSATIDSTSLSEGAHTLSAVLSDEAGFSASASVGVIKDVSVPQVSGLANDPIPAKSKSWSWACSEAGCAYRFVIDNSPDTVPAGAFGSGTSSSQNSGTGTYYLHIQARDVAGNLSDVVHVSAVLDNTAPDAPNGLSLITPATSPGNIAVPVIRVSGVTNVDTVALYSDAACSVLKASGVASGVTIDLTSAALAPGSYSFYAKATDPVGNASPCSTASVTYAYDNGSPSVTGLASDGTASKTKEWNWGCSKAGCTYRFVIDTNAATDPSGVYGASTSASQNSGTGTYYLHVQAKDAAGNESDVVHVSAVLDNTAPDAPNGLSLITPAASPGNVAAPVIRVSGITNGDTISIYDDETCALPALRGSGMAAGATIDLTSSVLASGNHSFYAQATDAAGNASGCSSANAAYIYDYSAPSVTGLANDGVYAKSKTWNWGCSEGGCTYRFVLDTTAETEPSGVYGIPASATQNSGSGTYYLHVQARDAAGNESAVVHVSAVLDNTAPTQPGSVNDGDTSGSSTASPTISWVASSDAVSGVDYYEVAIGTSAGGTQTLTWTNVGNTASASFSSLTLVNGTKYYASVRARDKAGNISPVGQGDGWTVSTGGGGLVYTTSFENATEISGWSPSTSFVDNPDDSYGVILPDTAIVRTGSKAATVYAGHWYANWEEYMGGTTEYLERTFDTRAGNATFWMICSIYEWDYNGVGGYVKIQKFQGGVWSDLANVNCGIGWAQYTVPVETANGVTLRILASGTVDLFVDDISVPIQAQTVTESFETGTPSGGTWTTGVGTWSFNGGDTGVAFIKSGTAQSGASSLSTNNVNYTPNAYFEITIAGMSAGKMRFWYRQLGYIWASGAVFINGVNKGSLGSDDTGAWIQSQDFTYGAGTNTFRIYLPADEYDGVTSWFDGMEWISQ